MSNVTVDQFNPFQVWKFWGSMARRWQSPHMYYGSQQGVPMDPIPAADKAAILDAVYTEMKNDMIDLGVDVFGDNGGVDPSYQGTGLPNEWKSFETANDNTNAFVIKASGYNWAYWNKIITEVVQPAFSRITARGGTPMLNLRVGGVEKWMRATGTNVLSSTKLDEFAEWILALVLQLKNVYGINVAYVSAKNEPEGQGYTPGLVADMAKKLIERFAANNLTTKVIAPETVTPRAALDTNQCSPQGHCGQGFLAHLVSRGIDTTIGGVAYHIYDYDPANPVQQEGLGLPDQDARYWLRTWANARSKPVFMTELSTDVKPYDPSHWNDTQSQAVDWCKDIINEMTETWMAGFTFMWAFWSGCSPVNQSANSYAVIKLDANRNYLGWAKPQFYDYFKLFINNIRPGMERVACSSDDPELKVVAWKDAPASKVVTFALNTGTAEKTVAISGNGWSDTLVVPAQQLGVSTKIY